MLTELRLTQMSEPIYIIAGARTPMAEYAGRLKDVPALELGAIAARAALRESSSPADAVDHVVFGNVLQTAPTPCTAPATWR